jgi:D-3-phosphoglycerate dehydrogenase
MKVIAFDPFLSAERAQSIGVEKVDLAELLRRADVITLHTPLTDMTKNIIDARAIEQMKPGVIIINCARGGLVNEDDLAAALKSGKVGGAGIDVFTNEPAKESVLFGAPNIVCTPHLGASTGEAQENVAIQIAEQMADYLTTGAVTNALNMPSISAEEAPRLTPWVKLADQLGSFAGQLTETGLKGVRIEYEGTAAELNTRALTAAALAGILRPLLSSVNMVSAPTMAKERGIKVEEVRRGQEGAYEGYIRLTITTERQERSVAGTVFSGGRSRIIQIKGINMEAELGPRMLYVTNRDRPGFIGRLGTALGAGGVNIATFNLGRQAAGEDAISLIEVDQPISDEVLASIQAVEGVVVAKRLEF